MTTYLIFINFITPSTFHVKKYDPPSKEKRQPLTTRGTCIRMVYTMLPSSQKKSQEYQDYINKVFIFIFIFILPVLLFYCHHAAHVLWKVSHLRNQQKKYIYPAFSFENMLHNQMPRYRKILLIRIPNSFSYF